jgi:hypothetical protein
MSDPLPEPPADTADLLGLGAALGQQNAFGLVAGRCAAAQAENLRRLREEKKYLRLAHDWRDFCSRYLGMSGSQADRIIALLEQFGPGYFELAQLTRISADTYRVVEPVVKDHALHYDGEAIRLDPENARKVAAVVAELRREARKKPVDPRDTETCIADIRRRFDDLVADIEALLRKSGRNYTHFTAALQHMKASLERLMKHC